MQTKKFDLRKGETLSIYEDANCYIDFIATHDQTVSISGNWHDQIACANYKIEADCITPPSDATGIDADYKGFKTLTSHTDIGGHYVKINEKIICQILTGFGDGRYRLKFSQGVLIR